MFGNSFHCHKAVLKESWENLSSIASIRNLHFCVENQVVDFHHAGLGVKIFKCCLPSRFLENAQKHETNECESAEF
jgi:hypothetical protein